VLKSHDDDNSEDSDNDSITNNENNKNIKAVMVHKPSWQQFRH